MIDYVDSRTTTLYASQGLMINPKKSGLMENALPGKGHNYLQFLIPLDKLITLNPEFTGFISNAHEYQPGQHLELIC